MNLDDKKIAEGEIQYKNNVLKHHFDGITITPTWFPLDFFCSIDGQVKVAIEYKKRNQSVSTFPTTLVPFDKIKALKEADFFHKCHAIFVTEYPEIRLAISIKMIEKYQPYQTRIIEYSNNKKPGTEFATQFNLLVPDQLFTPDEVLFEMITTYEKQKTRTIKDLSSQ